MKKNSFDQVLRQTSAIFSRNLKNLLVREAMTQKILGIELGVAESTISAYTQGTRLPTCDFLIKLKKRFPDLSIDDLLTGDLLLSSPSDSQKADSSSFSEASIDQYCGTYYSYYLDTGKKDQNRFGEITSSESILKKGILYLYRNPSSESCTETKCLAVFGIKNSHASRIMAYADLNPPAQVELYLQKHYAYNLYKGIASFSPNHVFIILSQNLAKKDVASIVLHRSIPSNPHYLGGLGTINSASTGRYSDPVVQLIGLSRYEISLSDEEIKTKLRFAWPSVDITMETETKEILALAKRLYKDSRSIENQENDLNRHIPTIIQSNLKYLLDKCISNNLLWYGRVSEDADDSWYRLIKRFAGQQNTETGDRDDENKRD